MLRNLLLSLAALVLLAAMVITGPGGGGIGSVTADTTRIVVALSGNDDATQEERQELVLSAAAIGSLYFCDKAGIYTAVEKDAALYQVAWARMVDIFAGYEKFEGSPMFMGAMYISRITNEMAMNGSHMKLVDDEYQPVALENAEVCMEAEAVLRTIMQPGHVLDGKWRAGQRGA